MRNKSYISVQARRSGLEKKQKISLLHIGKNRLGDSVKVHCENRIGGITVPLGIAGPLEVQNEDTSKSYYIPLATTEGALVASVNRGCKAVCQSGGVTIYSEQVGTTRGPVFFAGSLEKGKYLKKWITTHTRDLAGIVKKTSNYVRYINSKVQIIGPYVFVRFSYDTDQAMGMNMVTIATDAVASYIKLKTGIECISLAGNFDIDKKPAWLNSIEGKGIRVWAEAVITDKVVKEVLKTEVRSIYDVWLSKCMIGSAISGSLGFNSHYANIVAAFFIATGQDVAHTVEGSLGITTMYMRNNGSLLVSIYLPSIMVGLVGGGTKLPTQQEALSIIGAQNRMELAQVLGGAVLAGELSLLAALAQGSLAIAHQKLGR